MLNILNSGYILAAKPSQAITFQRLLQVLQI